MNVGGGIIGGAIFGVVGAVVWGAIAYFTGYEIGWIAWGVGGLVGLGCAWGNKGGGNLLGCIAVVITVLSILAGKYAAVEFSIRNEIGSENEVVQNILAELHKEEVVISYLANEIVEERQARGEKIKWPAGVNPEEASEQSDYPRAIWSKAAGRWERMSPEEKEAYRDQIAENVRANVQAILSAVSSAGFFASFSVMDLLFFGLAIATAWKFTAGGYEYADE